MIIYCFSSEDFKPKRLYMSHKADKSPKLSFGDLYSPPSQREAKEAKKRMARTGIVTPQQTKLLAERRSRLSRANPNLVKQMTTSLGKKKMIKEIGSYYDNQKDKGYKSREGWREWNKAYYPKDSEKAAKEKIMAMQQAIFIKLGVLGQAGADIDGKIGPFTLAAMAAIAKKEISGAAIAPIANTRFKKALIEAQKMIPEPEVEVDKLKDKKDELEKAKKKEEQAKFEASLAKNKEEIEKKKRAARHYREEADENKKRLTEVGDYKAFHEDQKKAEANEKAAKAAVAKLKYERERLEGKRDVALFGPEYVAKKNLEDVSKVIRGLWKELNTYKKELPGLEVAVEALSGVQHKNNLEAKKAQISKTEQELKKREGQARKLKNKIKELSA